MNTFKRKSLAATLSLAVSLGLGSLLSTSALAVEDLEKEDLKFGFIKLTDMAPLAIAYEKGFFEVLHGIPGKTETRTPV
jgi:nitrate/nitrite transport system substrate-binding protein